MSNHDAHEDAKTLRQHAAGMTYNDTKAEAVAKHRLSEIAMRIETGFYDQPPRQSQAEAAKGSTYNPGDSDIYERWANKQPQACPEPYAAEINRLRNVIQSACFGGLDAMIARWVELFPEAPVPTVTQVPTRLDLSRMVDRFLGWKLPADFNPDGGVRFTPYQPAHTPDSPFWPTGTNLLTAEQARAMFEYVTRGPAFLQAETVPKPPANCRQRLKAKGEPYPRSSCEACGQLSPRWRECDDALVVEQKDTKP